MTTFPLKKSLGQNFLVNDKIYHFMVGEIAPQKGELIIEVGPGPGTLTGYLTENGADVLAIEKDRRLIPELKEKFKGQKNVTILEEDILKFDPTDPRFDLGISKGRTLNSYKLVGNIPYYLTSHLLRVALENWPKPKLILFMVQKEVAQRITARPPEMNLLALAIQFYAEAKIVKNVSKNNFRPAPKVDSALIKILPRENIPCSKDFQKKIFTVARAGFGNKRKQILNSLVSNLKLNKESVIKGLNQAGIGLTRRPETLTIQEWVELTKSFQGFLSG